MINSLKTALSANYVSIYVLILLTIFLNGCGPKLSTPAEIMEFDLAGPLSTQVIGDDISKLESYDGPYRVAIGDILEFKIPAVLRVISSDISEWLRPTAGHYDVEPYLARVDNEGNITMPIISKVFVAGKTLAEIEAMVKAEYYPKYVVNPPMVVCEVDKYQNENERVFTVLGLVRTPDAFPYPPDVRYNLMEALAFAGGLNMVADPRYVTVYRQAAGGEVVTAYFDVASASIDNAYNIAIKPGDVIFVAQTLQTRTNTFFSDVFRFGVGANVQY